LTTIGARVKKMGRSLIVDAMSCFGAVPFDLAASRVDFLVSLSNKCLEGVPGCCFVLARREALAASEGRARSLSLDLFDQWRGLEATGQFRFTPPTHVILALDQAPGELETEGGVERRGLRYRANQRCLVEGIPGLGFQPFPTRSTPEPDHHRFPLSRGPTLQFQ
jgi:2-aminoethylphosphonate-pyruvate transaminase